jgi:hypothetical protein
VVTCAAGRSWRSDPPSTSSCASSTLRTFTVDRDVHIAVGDYFGVASQSTVSGAHSGGALAKEVSLDTSC